MTTALPQVDNAAFARAYERHHQALYRYCRSILRHEQDAQDALQSAMTRAFAALQTERRELELRPWLFRIAHNEAVTILRRRSQTSTLDDSLRDVGALEDRVQERETLRLLRHDLADLPERQRCALVLRELNGLGHEEIAAVLDIAPAAVKQAIFEGRSALLRCREGRDAACDEMQRILSDGDGRVVRSQRVRAHLRACAGCRAFRSDLGRRPRELALLAPPLPGGAGLLRWLLSCLPGPAAGGGLAAKAVVVVALAGGGGAAALHSHAVGPRETLRPRRPHAAPKAGTAARERLRQPGDVAARTPATSAPRRPSSHAGARVVPGRVKKATEPRPRDRTGASPGQAKQSTPHTPPGQAKRIGQASPAAPGQANKVTPPTRPGQAKKIGPASAAPHTPPGQAKIRPASAAPPGQGTTNRPAAGTPPGRADTHTTPAGQTRGAGATGTTPAAPGTSPGQAKKADPASVAPPGQAGPGTPPGQAKPDAQGKKAK